MNWRDYLKPAEHVELDAINTTYRQALAAKRRVYDRCRKRADKARMERAQKREKNDDNA